MLAYPSQFKGFAKDNGIRVPRNPNSFNADKYPHFAVFLGLRQGQMTKTEYLNHNTKIISELTED